MFRISKIESSEQSEEEKVQSSSGKKASPQSKPYVGDNSDGSAMSQKSKGKDCEDPENLHESSLEVTKENIDFSLIKEIATQPNLPYHMIQALVELEQQPLTHVSRASLDVVHL